MNDPISPYDVVIQTTFIKSLALSQELLFRDVPILSELGSNPIEVAVRITQDALYMAGGYDREQTKLDCLANQGAISELFQKFTHSISMSNVEGMHR